MPEREHRARLWDCFTFNDEMLLLEFRLGLLDRVVDRFVLVEADTTHQGEPKELVFAANLDRFARWLPKINHVVVRDMPPATDAWVPENFQRRAIMRGLVDADPWDIALISDVDEIPDPDAVRALKEMSLARPLGLAVRTTYFCVDLKEPNPSGWIPKACRVGDLTDPHAVRDAQDTPALPSAAWHLAWLSTQIDPGTKLERYAHVEYNTPWFKSARHARRCRELGVDLFGRFVLLPVPWEELGEPIQALATAHPELVHGPRGRWRSLLARCYMTNVWAARFLPLWLTDRHPVFTFMVAGAIRVVSFPIRRLRASRRQRDEASAPPSPNRT